VGASVRLPKSGRLRKSDPGLGNLARDHAAGVALCRQIGQAVRRELGETLQPALGWDQSKFTAQAAARRTLPGHLLAVAAVCERSFLKPLPVALLPLGEDPLRRLGFLGLRTVGASVRLPKSGRLRKSECGSSSGGRDGWPSAAPAVKMTAPSCPTARSGA